VEQDGRSRGEGIRIGHIDTGYSDHPELERSALDLSSDYDLIDNDDDARDPLRRAFFAVLDSPGHGTATGSVIAGRERGEISGVAPQATLVPFRAIKSVSRYSTVTSRARSIWPGNVAATSSRCRWAAGGSSGCKKR
jgi:subtilisin family serine protease